MAGESDMNIAKRQEHTIEPIFDDQSQILILGSFPSVKSRESKFYYGHPQNRFWKVIALVYGEIVPETIEEKKTFLKQHHIALWDVIASCEIIGSSDSSIQNAVPNDISWILSKSKISHIFINGGKAFTLFQRYFKEEILPPVIKLPSTSPANAQWSIERLEEEWKIIRTCTIM